MLYYSLNRQSPEVSFKEATIRGLAPDKGLYFPSTIPKVDPSLIKNIRSFSNEEIAFRIIRPFVDSIPEELLYRIVTETVNFPITLKKINDDISSLELYHGPTLAFKDVGARFMSRCLGQFVKDGASGNKKVVVLVATSGDTGGAVANGFLGQEGIDVVILYPSGKVSPVQEVQLASLGSNIHAIEIKGSFDDCQALVKTAFSDAEINRKLFLTSANSINIARWLPQQFYYFFAYKQWEEKIAPVISVPSGNFGNICAGILASYTGLPVKHFIAACNTNDVVPRYLKEGMYKPGKVHHTYSNAMDVADPSNFIRILQLTGNNSEQLRSLVSSYSISDSETADMISRVFRDYNYTLDPHGAVGYIALEKYIADHPGSKGVFLETAHPVKFPEIVEKATRQVVEIPEHLKALMKMPKHSVIAEPEFDMLKGYLLSL